MHELLISYANFPHGGRQNANYFGDGGPYNFDGLVRMVKPGQESDGWPHILIVGEGDRWDHNGGEGGWEAAAALREAGGRPYVPLCGSLPRQWGPFAPAVLFDPTAVVVRRWYGDERVPGFAERSRNVLVATLPGRSQHIRIITGHGDIYGGNRRLWDAQVLARAVDLTVPCLAAMDFNCQPSGPQWLPEPDDLNSGRHWPNMMPYRARWKPGPGQAGPHEWDTDALDLLTGWWDEELGERVGGAGLKIAAEVAGVYTPTQYPKPGGRAPRAIDHMLLTPPMAEAMVPGSYTVHEPDDPQDPPSDHKRISARFRLGG